MGKIMVLTGMLLLSWSCTKPTINRLEKKRGQWTLLLETTQMSCDRERVIAIHLDTIYFNFINGTEVIVTEQGATDTLFWAIIKVTSANPSTKMIEFKYKSGYGYKQFFVMSGTRHFEIWEYAEGCLFASSRKEYTGRLSKN